MRSLTSITFPLEDFIHGLNTLLIHLNMFPPSSGGPKGWILLQKLDDPTRLHNVDHFRGQEGPLHLLVPGEVLHQGLLKIQFQLVALFEKPESPLHSMTGRAKAMAFRKKMRAKDSATTQPMPSFTR